MSDSLQYIHEAVNFNKFQALEQIVGTFMDLRTLDNIPAGTRLKCYVGLTGELYAALNEEALEPVQEMEVLCSGNGQ